MTDCKARRCNDQMLCECGLAWDIKEPPPVTCPAAQEFLSTLKHPTVVGSIGPDGPSVRLRLAEALRKVIDE